MKRRTFLGSTIPPLIALSRYSRPARFRHARPVPSRSQLNWHRDELALFLHFGVNTFTDREWGDGKEDPAIFNPAGLDARQWACTAKVAGFKTLILTAKHHDGFCLWPSKLTTHSVVSSPWREGKGDVVRELVDACQAEGLKAGLYLSPWDRHEPSYGDSPRYNDHYIGQLTELLTWYGPIREVWFDGANGEGPNGKRQVYDWERIHRTVRQRQPEAVMFSDAGPDIRWIGNERGIAGDPNWCTMDPAAVPYAGADGPGIIEALQHGDPNGTVWRPGEADVSIRPGWFYHPAEDSQVRSTENLLALYRSSVGSNAGLLLNVPPNRDGLLSAADASRLDEFGSALRDLFVRDLAAGARATTGAGGVELILRNPQSFDHVVIQEDIVQGQTVALHSVEVREGAGWKTIAEGTTVGYKRVHRVPAVTASQVRLVIRSALAPPRISRFSLYLTP
ncbi:MAG: alpha-L-fucosidase [Gemmatimonadota bacterium]